MLMARKTLMETPITNAVAAFESVVNKKKLFEKFFKKGS
jgi:hypothetical protein